METAQALNIVVVNSAAGRLNSGGGVHRYDDADRTDDFVDALRPLRPDIVVATELNCSDGSIQLDRFAATLSRQAETLHAERVSDSHIPGVDHLGVGIASRYATGPIDWYTLPEPDFPLYYLDTGEVRSWHPKKFGYTELDTPTGTVGLVFGQGQPMHIAKDEFGGKRTYAKGAGKEYGRRVGEGMRAWLAGRGVRPKRLMVAGDLNMPNPAEFLSPLAGHRLYDAFGEGSPPATRPNGQSDDRVLASAHFVAGRHSLVKVKGADHFVCAFRFTADPAGTRDQTGRSRSRLRSTERDRDGTHRPQGREQPRDPR